MRPGRARRLSSRVSSTVATAAPSSPVTWRGGDPLAQQGEAEDDGQRRVERGEDDHHGRQLPLHGEETEHEAEGRPGSDEDGLEAADRRQPQRTGVPHGAGQQHEDGGHPAGGDGPQAAAGAGLAEREVLHRDARDGTHGHDDALPQHHGSGHG